MDHGPTYLSEAHRRACDEWDERLAGELPDDYLATFLAHFAAGKTWTDLPNSLLCPQPRFLIAEAKTRGWNHEEASDGTLTIRLPNHIQVLSPPPMTLPRKARRRID